MFIFAFSAQKSSSPSCKVSSTFADDIDLGNEKVPTLYMIRPLLCLQIVGLVRLLGAKDEKCPPSSSTLHRIVLIWDLVLVVCL